MSNRELNQLRVESLFSFKKFLKKNVIYCYVYKLLRVIKLVLLNI